MNDRPLLTLYCGVPLYWDEPERGPYHLGDIAHALSLLCRYVGQGRTFYSVAEHSVLVSHLVPPEDALWGLLHDSAEAYMNDLQSALKHLPEMKPYRDMEQRVLRSIARTFGLPSETEPRSVKQADSLLVPFEMGELGLSQHRGLGRPPWPPQVAESRFMRRCYELMGRGGIL